MKFTTRYHIHAMLGDHHCGTHTSADGIDKAVKELLKVGVRPEDITIEVQAEVKA